MTVGTCAAIFGCAGPVLLPEERAFFREADPFGFILFARNVEDPAQLRRLTADLRAAVGREAPVLVDQEGGRVQRLRAPHWREWTPPLDTVDAAGSVAAAERQMRLRAMVIAAELAAVGIDADCIPTLDVARPATHPFLLNRCYGRDPETVAQIGRAVAEGLMAGGVLPVMKHMPGHGLSHVDTHQDLPTVTVSREELQAVDFAPFRALADLPMAMTAHLVFAAIDPDRPATQSPDVIRLIREEIGFRGLLMSDDLNMQALSGTLAERTARTIAAGVDIALHCKGDLAEMEEVAGAAGTMGSETRARAEAAIAARREGQVDVKAALAELAHG
ncbi:glycoside hydrolase family 3 N-terminal domain-containing protein [Tabrizicola flagellatus]|uniref:glycoside hydrolase family 3 N-terminal domain-containing protein n=1 Tax=Tabrizicola flagellatus TaxID=2593021 RepID=UPI0011F288A2|nr:glycoside hydrolase family 3 N-terminal domain-containing protein [Tabrizicola flagellatus]